MTGPKLNEAYASASARGTKATAKYVRSSAYKARVVLDLIRGIDVAARDEVLQFTDRGIARDVRKVLARAVANAEQQRRAGRRRAVRDRVLRRRGPDAASVPPPCSWPCDPHSQAHLSHHGDRRSA